MAKGKSAASDVAAVEPAGAELVVQPGMVVLYVLGADGPGAARRGEIRPAMVVRVWDDVGVADVRAAQRQTPPLVQLQVFLDGTNDDPIDGLGLTWRTSVRYSAEHEVGTWHWPPSVEETARTFRDLGSILNAAASEASSEGPS